MKCKIPEISWHNRDPVLSVDIQPKEDNNSLYRLASGGTDSHVLIWSLSFTENGELNLDVAADLTRHQRAVNVVKWSPNGELLASADDESVVFIWKQKGETENVMLDVTNENDKETWITLKVLRGHMEDIYDLSWAPTSQFLVSGSVDNTAIIWDVQKGKSISTLKDHKGFVQGVAWDPKNQYIATLSTDRILRIFDIQTKKVVHRISKATLPVSEDNDLYGKKVALYHDDTLQTFFRRLCFSPDGKFLITPAGVADYDGATNQLHTTYVYSRFSLKQPSLVLPSPDQYTVAVKCCPIIFKLRNNADPSSAVIPLPYRMIFAIATKSSVYLYDTQQKVPFGLISNIHYTRLTDITWSNDGKIMIVSSTDGFCSIITFDDGELGEEYKDPDILQPFEPMLDKKNYKSKLKENGDQNKMSESENLDPTNEKYKENIKFSIEKIPHDLVIDKDIISSEQKFESPEKKMRLATPINIRRHPRTPNSFSSTQTQSNIKSNLIQTPNTSDTFTIKGTDHKQATPIAIRRQPRTSVLSNAIVEEAMDAWPSGVNTLEKVNDTIHPTVDSDKTSGNAEKLAQRYSINNDTASNCTEDIHLVYEESVDGVSNQDRLPTESSRNSPDQNKAKETVSKYYIDVQSECKKITRENSKEKFESRAEKTDKNENAEIKSSQTEENAISYQNIESNKIVKNDPNAPSIETSNFTSEFDPKEKHIKNDKVVDQPKNTQGTPEHSKTRRVELKTISTPKSRKMLLK